MSSCQQLMDNLLTGTCDQRLAALYALDGTQASLDAARARAMGVVRSFTGRFGSGTQGAALFSGPGRTEIGGNHTDHQHGRVLCGSVDLDMLACAAPNDQDVVRFVSEGYPALEIDLSDLEPKKEEQNTSAALVRGVAAKIKELGYPLSGFDACANSTVLSGSGLSSSAAYEVLVGNIFNHLCCGGKLHPDAAGGGHRGSPAVRNAAVHLPLPGGSLRKGQVTVTWPFCGKRKFFAPPGQCPRRHRAYIQRAQDESRLLQGQPLPRGIICRYNNPSFGF